MSVRLRASLTIFICESILWVFHFYRRPLETERPIHHTYWFLYCARLSDYSIPSHLYRYVAAEFSLRFASLQEIKFYSLSFTNWNHVSVGGCSCLCSRESVLVAICSMFRMRHWTFNWMKLNLMKFSLIVSYCTPFFVCVCGGGSGSVLWENEWNIGEREKLFAMKIGIWH